MPKDWGERERDLLREHVADLEAQLKQKDEELRIISLRTEKSSDSFSMIFENFFNQPEQPGQHYCIDGVNKLTAFSLVLSNADAKEHEKVTVVAISEHALKEIAINEIKKALVNIWARG